jgi:hypothetical protein
MQAQAIDVPLKTPDPYFLFRPMLSFQVSKRTGPADAANDQANCSWLCPVVFTKIQESHMSANSISHVGMVSPVSVVRY